ncbi:unnamed protein product [Mycetohabitans rhizoxinica HKI 454]|uniref:Uncharacterized protein n=1 Tax=Mycetohabitans rhizoxinica (strain DSM 19002 / CIP 109453 / HKI 454) TaxID=882378 RepID=E5AL42_MYCRK|nr:MULTISPECIES: hypothetical protein [Mycetohabitans]MCG1047886.1 hypothetical protein [Mycetohabitans sp. B6]CBW75999.1 unnamed protein product [Mycetohabitans rhizoxinica HKI 454]
MAITAASVRKPLNAFTIALLALAGLTGTAQVTEWTPMAVVGIAYRWPTAKYGFPHQCRLVSSTKKYGYPFCKGCGGFPFTVSQRFVEREAARADEAAHRLG